MTLRASLVLLAAFSLATAAACAPKAAPLPPPAVPRFPDFGYPGVPPALAGSPVAAEHHRIGWNWLQAGDLRASERSFSTALKTAPGFYPSDAGLGYVAFARKDYTNAISHFDRAIAADAAYTPALVGRGEAALALGQLDQALATFEKAVAADPTLSALQSRIEVLRFRGLQDNVEVARKAAAAGKFDEARAAYQRAITASPQSAFLYRELAAAERTGGNLPAALEHAQQALTSDPNEPRTLILIGDIHEAQGDYVKAAEALGSAVALEPNEALDARIDGLREKAAFAAMPAEYQSIETSPSVTRAQLASLLGVRLDDLLTRGRRRNAVVITDTRTSWAAPWILSVARAGLMEPYPNHTFQPDALVRRSDLAMAASRALSLIAAERPAIAANWRNARRRFPDVSPAHLSYPAASLAVEAGVMATSEDGSFQLSRPVTGTEAMAAIRKLEELVGRDR